jgi:hypothetical protein
LVAMESGDYIVIVRIRYTEGSREWVRGF